MFFQKFDSLLGGYRYYNMGQATKLGEPLDERIVNHLKKNQLEVDLEIAKIYNHGHLNSYNVKYLSVRSIRAN